MRSEILPKVKSKRLEYSVKDATEPKEIERALKIPTKEFLKKNILELWFYKGNRAIGLLTVPKNYSSDKLVKEIESELEVKSFTITSEKGGQASKVVCGTRV